MYQPKNFSDIAEPFSQLSTREQQVITLICGGLSNKGIAEKLGVTEGTIKAHLHAIFEKLGVRSRIELGRSQQVARLTMAGRALSRCTPGAVSHSQKESGPASGAAS